MSTTQRKYSRKACIECTYKVLQINGSDPETYQSQSGKVDDISKGGFSFTTNKEYQLEDRVQMLLTLPDGKESYTLGRISYRNETDVLDKYSYGFSIIKGFYDI